MPSVAIRDHRGNSQPYAEALIARGWNVVPLGTRADVLLIDLDLERAGYQDVIRAYQQVGARIVLYPHGANPITVWDGIDEPFPVDLCVTIGEGHRMVMDAYGYPNRVLVAGWGFSQIRRFEPTDGKRVLFAPIHPLGNGYLEESFREANARAFRTLLASGRDLHVRHMGSLAENGLWPEPDVTFLPAGLGDLTPMWQIDAADVVVATETFLSLAVARGKPAVAFHQVAPVDGAEGPGDTMFEVRSWDRYREIVRYPHDLAEPLAIETACVCEANGWRERFIGRPLDGNLLNDELHSLLSTGVIA